MTTVEEIPYGQLRVYRNTQQNPIIDDVGYFVPEADPMSGLTTIFQSPTADLDPETLVLYAVISFNLEFVIRVVNKDA